MVLVIIFSVISYQVLKMSIMQNEIDSLLKQAHAIIEISENPNFMLSEDYKIIHLDEIIKKPNFEIIDDHNKKILRLIYPYSGIGDYLILKRDITQSIKTLDTIFINLLLIIAIAFSVVVLYSLFVSKILSIYLKELGLKISKFENNFKNKLESTNYPIEFKEVIDSINHLITRIENYNSSQKELFIGIAHELKTPLAVMKAKNDVSLIKERDSEYYINTLKNSNTSIDNMNKIISEILKIGRLEGAQFEDIKEIDIIDFIKQESKNYSLLCTNTSQKIELNLQPSKLNIKIQQTLFAQILQNFIQNAIKFSPPNSIIKITTEIIDKIFYLFVEDEGNGIDESKDYFAPFKRFGDKEGVGLGLFLSKSAATALKAEVKLENRINAKGTKAIFKMKIK